MPITLSLTRDSVCAGDDGDAPHPRDITVPDGTPWFEILGTIATARYLASIQGDRATWSAHLDDRAIAVIAQQWTSPRPLPAIPSAPPSAGTSLRIHLKYHTQQDPEQVSEDLSR